MLEGLAPGVVFCWVSIPIATWLVAIGILTLSYP